MNMRILSIFGFEMVVASLSSHADKEAVENEKG